MVHMLEYNRRLQSSKIKLSQIVSGTTTCCSNTTTAMGSLIRAPEVLTVRRITGNRNVTGGLMAMEIERRLVKIERLSFRVYMAGGAILGALSLLTLGAFGFYKLVQYLWISR